MPILRPTPKPEPVMDGPVQPAEPPAVPPPAELDFQAEMDLTHSLIVDLKAQLTLAHAKLDGLIYRAHLAAKDK